MVDHPFRTAAATTSGVYTGVLLDAGVKRTILVLAVDELLADFTFASGEIPLAVAWAKTGYAYFYDSTDAVTVDDGLTTLVSGNGLRFAIEDSASISLNSALTIATAPPGSPAVGDVHIVGVGTGAFAGQDDNLAVRTRRGWVFASPEIGMTVLNEATGQNTQFLAAGWGAFVLTFADGSIAPKTLQFPAGIVVEDTLNTPPGSPTTGKFWIVGSVPTGAYVGHSADLAYWTGSAWAFMDAADGWQVYHKAFGFEVFYISGSWLGGAGSDLQSFSTAGAATWTKPARGNMAFVQAWGAGGSGGRSATNANGANGAGGGAYVEWLVPLSSLSATEAVSVGAGGVAATAAGNGNNGGNTTFGSYLTAYGGDAGLGGSTASATYGGAGGGLTARGSAGTGGTPSGGAVGANAVGGDSLLGGGGGGNSSGSTGRAGGSAINAGAGGASNGGGSGGSATAIGGNSFRGGAGGGARGWSGAGGAGGVSTFGGNGGAGGTSSANATAGAQPGGGGGGSETGNSGKGGDGRVRVTVF